VARRLILATSISLEPAATGISCYLVVEEIMRGSATSR
jgi:hypothetical protein